MLGVSGCCSSSYERKGRPIKAGGAPGPHLSNLKTASPTTPSRPRGLEVETRNKASLPYLGVGISTKSIPLWP